MQATHKRKPIFHPGDTPPKAPRRLKRWLRARGLPVPPELKAEVKAIRTKAKGKPEWLKRYIRRKRAERRNRGAP